MALELLTPASGISFTLALALAGAAFKVGRLFNTHTDRVDDLVKDLAGAILRIAALEELQSERALSAAREEGAKEALANAKSGVWEGPDK